MNCLQNDIQVYEENVQKYVIEIDNVNADMKLNDENHTKIIYEYQEKIDETERLSSREEEKQLATTVICLNTFRF